MATIIVSSLALVVSCIVGFVSIRTFVAGQRQRKLENSLRLLNLFNEKITADHLRGWETMFTQASELAGAKSGHFKYEGEIIPLSELFGDGGAAYDNGAIDNMASQFDLIGYHYLQGTIEIVTIYFELGQYMDTVHRWISTVNLVDGRSLLQSNYKHFAKMYTKIDSQVSGWPRKTIRYIE